MPGSSLQVKSAPRPVEAAKLAAQATIQEMNDADEARLIQLREELAVAIESWRDACKVKNKLHEEIQSLENGMAERNQLIFSVEHAKIKRVGATGCVV